MRAFKKTAKRGFTLVELMIVVAIIGVLAALAIYGVRRYLATAKTAEAKEQVGAISRAAEAAYERETTQSEIVALGGTSAAANHELCGSATPVPAAPPTGRKYQPDPGADFEATVQGANDATNGWKCLKFEVSSPIYYQYGYQKDGRTGFSSSSPDPGANGFEAAAQGDLDGDGTFSTFARGGTIDVGTGQLRLATQVFIEEEFE
jgi:type IV pilus assembly protein PilA